MLYSFMTALIYPLARLIFRVRAENKVDLPEGPLVIIANHKNNLDPVMISLFVNRKIRWMGKKELFDNRLLGAFLTRLGVFPVDREKNDLKSMKKAMQILKDGGVLGIFPEGTRRKEVDYKAGKPGTALLASRMGARIQPIFIEGDYKLFRPLILHYRSAVELSPGKKSEDEYRKIMENLMKRIYEGDRQIGNLSK